MIDLIKTLNTCSEDRAIFYCVVFLMALGLTVSGLVKITTVIFKKIKKSEHF